LPTEAAPPEAPPANSLGGEPPAVDAVDAMDEAVEPPVAPVASPAACGTRLGELFPALFGVPPKPLKLRIQADIQARAPGVFTKALLSAFLHRYTTGTAYLNALSRATERFDLDGQPAGELSEEHRAAAAEEVKRRRALRDERIAKEREAAREAARAAEREARRQANEARRAEEASRREADHARREAEGVRREEDDARRERARLLRDYETTRLTRSNFCVLRGVPEAQLDTLLELARREAVEWAAQRAAREAGSGGGDGRAPREHREPRDAREPRDGGPRPAGSRPGGAGAGFPDRRGPRPGGPGGAGGAAGRDDRRGPRPGRQGDDRPRPARGEQGQAAQPGQPAKRRDPQR
jgi:sRNA-binding protein